MGGKGEIENKLDAFVEKCFQEQGLNVDDGVMSREDCRNLFKRLMTDKNKDQAWNDDKFDRIFNLFEEDDPAQSMADGKKSGLDKSEFIKLVKRVAQL